MILSIKRCIVLVSISLIFVIAFASSQSVFSEEPTPSPTTYTINIPAGAASPDAPYFWQSEKDGSTTGDIAINRFDSVRWTNVDTAAHTITSGTRQDGPNGIFDSGLFLPGNSFQHQFTQVGKYPYHCIVHPWKTGIVYVGLELQVSKPPTPYTTPTPSLTPSIQVWTDKSSYRAGDIVHVSVEVRDLLRGFQISLQVFEPKFGNMVYLDKFSVDGDKKFSTEIDTGLSLFSSVGTYTIAVQYRVQAISAETTFYLSGTPLPTPEPEPKIPEWVRTIFIWYAEERISENELLGAIQFLIDQGILKS